VFGPRVTALLTRVGLADRAADPVSRLSGGEMQRVAICRALLRRPRLLLADEPTGNLDPATGAEVQELLIELNRERRVALIVVTHNPHLAAAMDRVLRLHGGVLEPVVKGEPL